MKLPEDALNWTDEWMTNFEKRKELKARAMHGEAGSAAIDDPNVEAEIQRIKQKIAEYEPNNIYSIDKTGFFYKQAPTMTISKAPLSGLKADKTRMTITLVRNADGSRSCAASRERQVCGAYFLRTYCRH